MKKKIFLIVLIIVILLTGLLIYTQMNNIQGIIYSLKYSSEEIENLISENDDSLVSHVEGFIGHSVRPFTEEETKQIESGEVSKEQILEKIVVEELEKTISSKANNNSQNTGDRVKNPTDDTPNNDVNYVSLYITDLYSIKSEFIGRLDGMVSQAINEYKSLDKKQRTQSKKLEIGVSYAKQALSLEKECDTKVNSLLSSLEKQLKADSKSTDIIATLKSAYNSEKALKRAYYLNMFK